MIAVTAALLLAGCGGDQPDTAATATTTSATTEPVAVTVRAAARGPGGPAALARAAERATPELEGFLARYLTAAFTPATADRAAALPRFFDAGLHDAVGRDLAALSLGPAAETDAAVRLEPAEADATFLVDAVRPLAATVVLRLTGSTTAAREHAAARIGMHGRFQLLRGSHGWRITAYETRTRTPAP